MLFTQHTTLDDIKRHYPCLNLLEAKVIKDDEIDGDIYYHALLIDKGKTLHNRWVVGRSRDGNCVPGSPSVAENIMREFEIDVTGPNAWTELVTLTITWLLKPELKIDKDLKIALGNVTRILLHLEQGTRVIVGVKDVSEKQTYYSYASFGH